MSLGKCPECGKRATVVDSRTSEGQCRRRYRCTSNHRFSSIEIVMVMAHGKRSIDQLRHAAANASLMADAASDLRTIAKMLDRRKR